MSIYVSICYNEDLAFKQALTMNIPLISEIEKCIQEKVNRDYYTSVRETTRESPRLMHANDDIQKQRIAQLNHSIETGSVQLKTGNKARVVESYQRIKKKIINTNQDYQ